MAQGLAASRAIEAGQDIPAWVCTSQGYQQIALGDEQPAPDHSNKTIDCPVCLAHAIGMAAMLPGTGGDLPAPLTRSFVLTGTPQAGPSLASTAAPYHTRAPPYFA